MPAFEWSASNSSKCCRFGLFYLVVNLGPQALNIKLRAIRVKKTGAGAIHRYNEYALKLEVFDCQISLDPENILNSCKRKGRI